MTILSGIVWVIAWSLTASVAALILALVIWHTTTTILELIRGYLRTHHNPEQDTK